MQGKSNNILKFAQMKIVEFLRIGYELLKLMSNFGLKCEDYKYIEMYDEYSRLRSNGEKTDYILAVLSDKYKLSESTIKRVIRRFSKEVNC